MKFIKVETSQGSLGKNNGCEKAPNILIPEAQAVKIVENNIEETNENIENTEGDFFVGGDHSITYPLFRGFAQKYGESALIVFDAHADCVNDFHPPSHEDFNKTLVQENTLHHRNLFLIGLRKVDKIEEDWMHQRNIKHIYYDDLPDNETLIKQIKEFAQDKALYVSIDIDVLKPEEAPGTGYLPEGGMTLNQLLEILTGIKKGIRRVDLVEINPDKDIDNKTIDAGKKIINILS